jgi:hypothetical protein
MIEAIFYIMSPMLLLCVVFFILGFVDYERGL